MSDLISRQDAIDALWKALYAYEDNTEKQFQESDELDVGDWILHRGFVQNMSDIDRQTILALPTIEAEPIKHGHWVNGFNSPLKCSSCGIVNRANEITLRTDFKFCPYCGAKMDGVKE